jgi:uncharacterized protein (DUF111 family)
MRIKIICIVIVIDRLEQMSTKFKKLDIMERRLGERERNVASVKTELDEVKVKVHVVEESTTFINRQFEDQKQDVSDMKNSVNNLLGENEIMVRVLNVMSSKRIQGSHSMNDISIFKQGL